MSGTSFISHRAPDGFRFRAVMSLGVLQSLDAEKIEALNNMNIVSLSDLLHFDPVHKARLVVAVAEKRVAHDIELAPLVADSAADLSPAQLAAGAVELIDGVGNTFGHILRTVFGVQTIADLARFAPFEEAETLMRNEAEAFTEQASAPDGLIPNPVGAVASTTRLNTFVAEFEVDLKPWEIGYLSGTALEENGYDLRIVDLFGLPDDSPRKISLGYIALHRQRWLSLGLNLGEVIHSVGLAAGESRNIAVVDWKRRLLTSRGESTQIGERLSNALVHTRALEEVAQATALEHQFGRTDIDASTAVSGGSVVGAAAAVGAVGGAIVGGVAGLVIGNAANVAGGAPTIAGAAAGAAVGAIALGGAAGLIWAGSEAIGRIRSESSGDRAIVSRVHQDITDLTSQNASMVRSLMSTVVLEDFQSEREEARTFNITNYNHMHALTILYFEVLQRYQVSLQLERVEPILFLPYRPLTFTRELISDYWEFLRPAVQNETLVQQFESLLGQDGQLEASENPVDLPQARLRKLRIRVRRPVISQQPNLFVETANGDAPPVFIVVGDTVVGADGFTTDYYEPVPNPLAAGTGPLINDIQKIRLELPFPLNLNVTYKIAVQAEFSDSTDDISLPYKKLSNVHFQAALGEQKKTTNWTPADQVESAQQEVQQVDDILTRVIRHFNARRYFFTRVLLQSMEDLQLADIITALEVNTMIGSTRVAFSLTDLADPRPVGITSQYILLRLKTPLPHTRLDNIANNQGLAVTIDPATRQIVTGLSAYRGDTIKFYEALVGKTTHSEEVVLPTSGLFAEAVLGRSNCAEKLDITRFANWIDSPIPNGAPVISALNLGGRGQPTPELNATITDGVLNLMQPTPLPDPTGMGAILGAIQNGAMFRDMSGASILGGTLQSLAKTAENVASAAGNLSGTALNNALDSAAQVAKSVADAVTKLAGDGMTNMTREGARINENKKENGNGGGGGGGDNEKENETPPTPPTPPMPQAEIADQIDELVREVTFDHTPMELDQAFGLHPIGHEVELSDNATGQTVTRRIGRVILDGFGPNSASLLQIHRDALDQLSLLLDGSGDSRLGFIGHADSTGAEAVNQDLSRQRAEAARTYLGAAGFDATKIFKTAVGAGTFDQPIPASGGADPRNRAVTVLYSIPKTAIVPIVSPSQPPAINTHTQWSIRLGYTVMGGVGEGVTPIGLSAALLDLWPTAQPDDMPITLIYIAGAWQRFLLDDVDASEVLDLIKDLRKGPYVAIVKGIVKSLWGSLRTAPKEAAVVLPQARAIGDFTAPRPAFLSMLPAPGDFKKTKAILEIPGIGLEAQFSQYDKGFAKLDGVKSAGMLFMAPDWMQDLDPGE